MPADAPFLASSCARPLSAAAALDIRLRFKARGHGALLVETSLRLAMLVDAVADVNQLVGSVLGLERRLVRREADNGLGPSANHAAFNDAIHLEGILDARLVCHLELKKGEGAVVFGGTLGDLLDL